MEGDIFKDSLYFVLPKISIHALRVEGDFVVKQFAVSFKISIHALRVEGDLRSGTKHH